MRAHAGAVYGVDFCADSRFVISAGEDATARLWSLEVRCNAGDLLLTCCCEKTLLCLHLTRAWTPFGFVLQRGCALSVYSGHEKPVWTVASAPVGPYFATGSLDHTALLWTIERPQPIRMFAGHLADVDAVSECA